MPINSTTIAYDTAISELLPTCVNGVWGGNIMAGSIVHKEQESHTAIVGAPACMMALLKTHCGVELAGTIAMTNREITLPNRPVYTMEEGKLVLDPSIMEVNTPYHLDVFGTSIWAMKDDSDEVVFFELGE